MTDELPEPGENATDEASAPAGNDTEATVAPAVGEDADATGEGPDVSHLRYEDARDELVSIVSRLEGGRVDLEDTMALWERGEALAAHCSAWLDGAEQRLARRDAANGEATDAARGRGA